MLRSIQCAILLAMFAIPTPAFAWCAIGQEVICEIAFQELTPAARAKVEALIERDNEFDLFAKSCSWPDRPRRRPKEHYVNLPRDAVGFAGRPCPVAEKCVVSAVLEDMSSLALATDEDDQLRALKGLSHWVADLHQPMHVSFHDDRGANKINVKCSMQLQSACRLGQLHYQEGNRQGRWQDRFGAARRDFCGGSIEMDSCKRRHDIRHRLGGRVLPDCREAGNRLLREEGRRVLVHA